MCLSPSPFHWGCLATLAALVSLASPPALGAPTAPRRAGEFSLDEHTLVLAHFNENAYKADYAIGWSDFAGSGAGLTEGYWGKAVDLRGVQFHPDFLNTCSGRLPRFVFWGIWPHGNIHFYQGTWEFFFKVSPDDLKQNRLRRSLFFTHYHQPLRGSISGTYLSQSSLTWKWHTLSGDVLQGKVNFDPPLDPNDWHHYAMCWSQGEFVLYIDGRAADSADMTGKHGLALVAQPHSFLAMNGIAMDELRISDVVRYTSDFEPPWRDGQRPAYAFTGTPNLRRYPAKTEPVSLPSAWSAPARGQEVAFRLAGFSLAFDRATGFLTGLAMGGTRATQGRNGLLLWEGLERTPLTKATASTWRQERGRLSFEQRFGDRVTLRHTLAEKDASIAWKVTFVNHTDQEVWLEALLSLPVPLAQVQEYFDMSCVQNQLPLPRRRDAYNFSLPFVAAAGDGRYLGAGVDPHIDLSALISEWIPDGRRGTLRQGTRVVLDPKGEYSLEFRLLTGEGEFGVLDAVAGYHALFPDLYHLDPTVPIYSYMPIARYFEQYQLPDLARICYVGMQWGHGPGHCKGDEWGTQWLWDLVKDPTRPDHEYTMRLQKTWGSLSGLREQILLRSKRAYENWYSLRRSHYLPNWAMRFVVEAIWPEGMVGGDPLVAGQYYEQMYYANEYQTPLGKHYKESTLNIMKHIGAYSPGFINDMCHTSPMRFTDSIARKTPGRAFARERGTYLVGAFGHADRYRLINSFRDARGFRQSIWSDGGVNSYTLSALSAADAIESFIVPEDTTGPELGWRAARYLLGEKPLTMHCSKESDYTGSCFSPTDFTPATLRDYYRYVNAQILLAALRYGIGLPYDLVQGQQEILEQNPLLVESIVLGRQVVDGARVQEPLFVRRGGKGLNTILVVGNEQPQAITSPLVAYARYFGGRPLFGRYFGGHLVHQVETGATRLEGVTVAPRSMEGFKVLGRLLGTVPCRVETTFHGDGIRMEAQVHVEAAAPVVLELSSFAPIYQTTTVRVNNKVLEGAPSRVNLQAGRSVVQVEWTCPALAFTAEDWQAVDLLRERKTNFCLVVQPDSAFNRGTAGWLNDFVEQYDEEDGVLGNLEKAPLGTEVPAGFVGWKVFVHSEVPIAGGRVRVDRAARAIHIEGPIPGEARRAMALFMRLVDRKYPHVGRYFTLKYRRGPSWSPIKNQETTTFFEKFEDAEFLTKPILRRELEPLYEGGRLDFERRYTLRFAPYLFEPTYGDNYVYGYQG